MHSKKNMGEIVRLLELDYPDAKCSLDYIKDYELLFATRLAAQCTDERVNKITPAFYAAYPTLQAIAEADIVDVEKYVHSCGFYHAKAKDIVFAAQMLVSDFDSRVPDKMEDLLKLPGVGRKTANLILGDVYGKPAVVVDTHCIRLTNRIGLVDMEDPFKIELALRKMLPSDKSSDFCHRLVLHGRAVCPARNPKCAECSIRAHCDYFKKLP